MLEASSETSGESFLYSIVCCQSNLYIYRCPWTWIYIKGKKSRANRRRDRRHDREKERKKEMKAREIRSRLSLIRKIEKKAMERFVNKDGEACVWLFIDQTRFESSKSQDLF